MKKTLFITIIIALTFFTSCGVLEIGTNVQTSMAHTNAVNCNGVQKHVNLFFEGEKTDFKYQSIGYVQVVGNQQSTNDELLQELRYQAWLYCSNAIINVKTSYKTREIASLGQDYSKNPPRQYSAPVLSGLAIYVNDSDLPEYVNHGVDTSFLTFHRYAAAREAKSLETQTTAGVFTGIIAAVIAGVVASNRKP